MLRRAPLALLALAAALAAGATAAAEDSVPAPEPAAACADRDPLRSPFFGDLHVHTAWSLDAATQDTRNTPRDAYRFARGEEIGLPPYDAQGRPGRHARLARPLDFAAVTDHAELLGEVRTCSTPGLPGYDSWACSVYRRWPRLAFYLFNYNASLGGERLGLCGPGGRTCVEAARTPWRDIRDAAEAALDRSPACRFTTFVGYEWTGTGDTYNIHRNVIFASAAVPERPVSFYDEQDPARLWDALERGCREAGPGCDFVVIPHNSNLGADAMFRAEHPDGRPYTREDALARAAHEPLVEVMQHKGDSECRILAEAGRAAGPAGVVDEPCAFEKLPYDGFRGKFVPWLAGPPPPQAYVRNALGRGLELEARLGANPFKLGMIASTDTHLGTPGLVDERDHKGHGGAGAPAAGESGLPDDLEFNPGGLAVVWAEENSRASLFAGLRRRETYGTSGPRLAVRFFGGWRYADDLCERTDFAAAGYAGGVPMGGDLPPRSPDAGAPVFAVRARRDPGPPGRPGTPLQRVQVVKGWLEDGVARERVVDVAGGSGDGAGVDLATCEPYGPGADELCAVWRDPDFDPDERAFYYARVLENPTCRWSQWACNAAGVDCTRPDAVPDGYEACCAADHRRTVQERAWTSPVWYAPVEETP